MASAANPLSATLQGYILFPHHLLPLCGPSR
jgi:hypothetical protein